MTRARRENAGSIRADASSARRSRRQALALGGAAAAAAAVAALGVNGGKKAQAAPTDLVVIGQTNYGEDQPTGLEGWTRGKFWGKRKEDAVFFAHNVADPVGEMESAVALTGESEFGEGVIGITRHDRAAIMGIAALPGIDPPVGGLGAGIGVGGWSGSGDGVGGHSGSGSGGTFISESGIGVVGRSASATGVAGVSPGESPAVLAESAIGIGPWEPDGGLALDVVGKARFSTAGDGVVPAKAGSTALSNSAVTADSHVTVTFTSDPGAASVAWVERQPGTGFIVHLSSRPRWNVPFTYLIVEPGM